jgi:hypothetical protein
VKLGELHQRGIKIVRGPRETSHPLHKHFLAHGVSNVRQSRASTALDVMSTRIESLSGARRVQPIGQRPEGNIDEDEAAAVSPQNGARRYQQGCLWPRNTRSWQPYSSRARLPSRQEHNLYSACMQSCSVLLTGGRASSFGSPIWKSALIVSASALHPLPVTATERRGSKRCR